VPSPIELIMDPVVIAIVALYAGLLAWEALLPARVLPRVEAWWASGLMSFVAYFFVSSYLPFLVGDRLAPLRLYDASALGTLGGAAAALGTYQLLAYAWHRSMHSSSVLFRMFHQMHHSAERHDALGAFWFSPLDAAGFTIVSAVALTLVGVTAEATAAFVLFTTLLSIFQHANVKTPVWLGYLVQRPESHSHHHARGVHRDNYSDLTVLDLVFGTFRNPKDFVAEQGYYHGASSRVVEMLAFRDVTEPASRPSFVTPRPEGA
jgi:sterol desaturase/sphingolipid hydroxylase (fatty acid hydroxylase superfamily)